MAPIVSEADRLVRIIEKGRRGEREAIIPTLEGLSDETTLQRFRTLILEGCAVSTIQTGSIQTRIVA
jgi:hypothetical protein